MLPKEITWLGEVAADAARRAIPNVEQNRGQFVSKVVNALTAIPENLRGEETKYFLEKYKNGAYNY